MTMNSKAQPSVRRGPPAARTAEHSHDPVDLCLELWKEWMQQCDRDLGAHTMRGLAGEGDGYGSGDVYEAQRRTDMRIGEATNAQIENLSRIHYWAIYRACSIATAWRFPNADFIQVLAEARDELETKLRKNICTAVLFG
jgi:hypothetical protein